MKSVTRWCGPRGLAAILGWAILSGCGGGSGGELPAVPAAGTVTYQGKAVDKGTVYFLPEKGRPATGSIDGGKFALSTYKDGDGAVAGKHKVAVTVTEDVKTKDGDTTSKYIVPQKYADPEGSRILVDIPADGKKDIAIVIDK